MGSALLSVPVPHELPFSQRSAHLISGKSLNGSRASVRFISKPFISLCSTSPASIVEEEQKEDASSFEALPLQPESATENSENLSFRGCKACGREEIEMGCNGNGSIQGGIATFPGFGWWPIKAYRPCPGFVASGGRYRRRGQSMDEVASGGSKKGTSASKEKTGVRQFKK